MNSFVGNPSAEPNLKLLHLLSVHGYFGGRLNSLAKAVFYALDLETSLQATAGLFANFPALCAVSCHAIC